MFQTAPEGEPKKFRSPTPDLRQIFRKNYIFLNSQLFAEDVSKTFLRVAKQLGIDIE